MDYRFSGIGTARARRDRRDPRQIAADRHNESSDRLTRRRHEAHAGREVGDRPEKRRSCDTWRHHKLPPRRHAISVKPMILEIEWDSTAGQRSTLRVPCVVCSTALSEREKLAEGVRDCQRATWPVTCVALCWCGHGPSSRQPHGGTWHPRTRCRSQRVTTTRARRWAISHVGLEGETRGPANRRMRGRTSPCAAQGVDISRPWFGRTDEWLQEKRVDWSHRRKPGSPWHPASGAKRAANETVVLHERSEAAFLRWFWPLMELPVHQWHAALLLTVPWLLPRILGPGEPAVPSPPAKMRRRGTHSHREAVTQHVGRALGQEAFAAWGWRSLPPGWTGARPGTAPYAGWGVPCIVALPCLAPAEAPAEYLTLPACCLGGAGGWGGPSRFCAVRAGDAPVLRNRCCGGRAAPYTLSNPR